MTEQNLAFLTEVNIRYGNIGNGADGRLGSAGYDSAWSTLLLREDKFGAEVDPMWITQLSHWDRALSLQNQKESPEEVTTFNAFNTRMICCTSLCTSTERS
jgi:FKBP12-rapamycin complex-associated protein